jgi:hypothetical protein
MDAVVDSNDEERSDTRYRHHECSKEKERRAESEDKGPRGDRIRDLGKWIKIPDSLD